MSNHSIDCEFCGEDLRGGGHAAGCSALAYEQALREYHALESAYVAGATAMWRQTLAHEERDARTRFRTENPVPPKPPTLWERRKAQAVAVAEASTAPVVKTVPTFACVRCKDTGVIDTGNNDLPCDCAHGDTALFNVTGRTGLVSGLVLKTEGTRQFPLCGNMKFTLHGNETCAHPQGHEGECRYVEHDCPDCGTRHGTCRQCGATHGDSHLVTCPHARRCERS